MNQYWRSILLLLMSCFILIACTKENEQIDNNRVQNMDENEQQNNNENEHVQKGNSDDSDKDLDEINDNKKEVMDVDALINEDHYINGTIFIKENENLIRVEAETNLIEGLFIGTSLKKGFGMLSSIGTQTIGSTRGKVDSNGNVTIDIKLKDGFFETYNGLYAEITLFAESSEFANADPEIFETYGPNGEKFKGPLIYQYERNGLKQRLETSVVIKIGDEKTEYDIETPVREPLPDDYGETDIWIEADVVDNDHRFLYVEGKTNILEGVLLSGGYYADKDQSNPDGFRRPNTTVEPDGTFFLPVLYDSLTEDGYIRIHSTPQRVHTVKELIYDTYGEKFEKLTGEVVIKKDDEQEIEFILRPDGLGIGAPENSMITEDDGELKINMPDDVLFDFDKSDLKDSAKKTLDEAIAILEDLDRGQEVRINGHTDNEGEHDYNMDLSEKRAESVKKYITANGNVDHLDIITKGFGPTEPIASNEEKEGREKNRRVEIAFDEKN